MPFSVISIQAGISFKSYSVVLKLTDPIRKFPTLGHVGLSDSA